MNVRFEKHLKHALIDSIEYINPRPRFQMPNLPGEITCIPRVNYGDVDPDDDAYWNSTKRTKKIKINFSYGISWQDGRGYGW
jgi:hypothetical protein